MQRSPLRTAADGVFSHRRQARPLGLKLVSRSWPTLVMASRVDCRLGNPCGRNNCAHLRGAARGRSRAMRNDSHKITAAKEKQWNRQLGRSGLRISAMTLGTMGFGGGGMYAKFGTGDVQDARRQIDLALEAGVNMIDTADIYSNCKAEEIVGEALWDAPGRVILATKAHLPMGEGAERRGPLSPSSHPGLEASLRRLGTDHIDLYQLHAWMGRRRSRRPSAPSSTSSIAARCAMSGVRTSPAGR